MAISAFNPLSSARRSLLPASDTFSGLSSICCCNSSSGIFLHEISTVKQVPFPGSLFTEMSPFIRSTNDFTIRSPRPVPIMPLSEELRSRVNASKIYGTYSLLIPMPLSDTRICKVIKPSRADGFSSISRTILPPSDVYFTALLKRFIMISRIFRASQYTFACRIFTFLFTVSCLREISPSRRMSSVSSSFIRFHGASFSVSLPLSIRAISSTLPISASKNWLAPFSFCR